MGEVFEVAAYASALDKQDSPSIEMPGHAGKLAFHVVMN